MRVKIVIQCNADTACNARELQDILISGCVHVDFRHMQNIPAFLAQHRCGCRGQPLVQKNPFHATRGVLINWSSTAAAA